MINQIMYQSLNIQILEYKMISFKTCSKMANNIHMRFSWSTKTLLCDDQPEIYRNTEQA